jgi:dimethylglycine dehydrogenase
MKTNARVVVVGGGMMGASLLYHLALEGCSDTILIEKSELTSGSTPTVMSCIRSSRR